jgi:type IV pilus assembly protein PilY1
MYANHHPQPLTELPQTAFEASMSRISNFAAVRWVRHNALALATVPLVATVSFLALSGSAPPSIPAINLSADPLYAATTGDKPALALALSVEFPTVGAQYVDPDNNNSSTTDDVTYSPTNEYIGYYDAESCYTYDNAGTGAPTGMESNYKRFVRRGPALPLSTPNPANPTWTSRMCWDGHTSYSKDDGTTPASSTTSNDAFSGNFLNWASSSAIDMLRLSLTGGDRVIDTPTLTVLQRAVIPDGDPISMGNSSNFPSKRLYRSGTSRAITSANFASASYASGVDYFGAVPSAMATAAGSNDIYVANTLNRIYFGTSKSGNNSGGFGSYTLGVASSSSAIGPVTNNPFSTRRNGKSDFGGTSCASEWGTCSFTGKKEVLYGSGSSGGGWITFLANNEAACTNNVTGTFIDPAPGITKECYYRDYTGTNTWTPTASAAALNSDGYFFARVQVCDRDPTTFTVKEKRFWELCTQYSDGASTPHAAYKPTGVIQKFSDQLRLAAFGYLLDQTASYSSGRYGGVLRAPMKYVGLKTYDINGNAVSANAHHEWDATTGVFVGNPDGNSTVPTTDGRATYLSGVINYVNQFGRTGSVPGRYKKYDPVGELHYETLRYLQGLPPSADAISSITTAMYDGYPVAYNAATGWTDPYGDGRTKDTDYSCTKSNIVVIGDKNTHDGNRLPTPSVANNILDINAWRTVVQNFEKNVTTATYVDGSGATRSIANPNGANSSVPTATATSQIMGSAYWARTHDIRGTTWTNATSTGAAGTTLQRPGLRVKTFMFDVNEYGASNDATARHTSNQLFMAAKYGGFETNPSNSGKNPYNTYGNPFKNESDGSNNNYVWQDTSTATSRVGEANSYYLQSDARGVLNAFTRIFGDAASGSYNIGGGANNSKQNRTLANGVIYQGKFDTHDWSGDLEARLETTKTLVWSAAHQLDVMASPASSRKIVIGKVGATTTPAATDFTWSGIAGETALQAALNSTDALGESRLNYLRGDKSKEGSPFRMRNSLLGDLINSGAVYSGKPSTDISSSTYASFASAHNARTPAVFAGANDGMLHAFNANTGDELFAYIPSWLGPKLAALTNPAYVHQSYVDSSPTVAEAQVGSSGTSTDWRTVLVSGTGGGGQGVFALDVTDPASFSASNVMWEFTHTDDSDLGNVMGKPQILKLRTNAYSAATPTYKWFAVFGSGVNNYVSDSAGRYSSTGNPALFLLDLSKAAGSPWTLGSNYYKISLPVDSTLSASKPTGLINFAADTGPRGEVTVMYMGDLHGKFWKLDFSLSLGASEWDINKLSYFNKGTIASPVPYPMFIAKDDSGNIQPIVDTPLFAQGSEPGTRYIYFGTGKYYEAADKASTATQTAYGLFDNGSTSGDYLVTPSTRTSAISGRTRLKHGTALSATGTFSTPAFTHGRAASDLDSEAIRSGWYADLPNSGERQTTDATLFPLSMMFGFNSLIPGSSVTSGCATASDSGYTYICNIATGSCETGSGSTVGLLGEIMIIPQPDLTTQTPTDSTGKRIKILASDVWQLGSQGSKKINTVYTAVPAARLSWRQINNYQDLK